MIAADDEQESDATAKAEPKGELTLSERQFRTLLDAASDGMLVADAATKHFHFANRRICDMLGYTRQELLELSVESIHPPDSLPLVFEAFRRQQHGDLTLVQGLPVLLKDGTVRYVDINSTPVEIDGQAYVMGIFRDATERLQALEAIQKHEAILEAVGDAAQELMLGSGWRQAMPRVLERLGQSATVSRVYVGLREVRPDGQALLRVSAEWAAPGLQLLVDKPSRSSVALDAPDLMPWLEPLQKGEPVVVNVVDMAEDTCERMELDDTRTALVVPMFSGSALRGIVGFDVCGVDHTWGSVEVDALRTAAGLISAAVAREDDEGDRSAMQAQLLQSQKMEALGKLAGGIAHDFNNLMTVTRGYADLALLNLAPEHPAVQGLEHIKDAAERASRLTRQLLLFTRRQPAVYDLLDLNDLVASLHVMLRAMLPENIVLHMVAANEALPVRGNRSNLEQLIVNFVVNARDAIGDKGGMLHVILERNSRTAPHSPEQQPIDYAVVSVSDTGIGMDPQMVERIFEPFFTTKEAGMGTGLGLAIAYGIVTSHGGWIDVDTSPGGGSTFRARLPLADTQASVSSSPSGQQTVVRNRQGRVLVVEDEQTVRAFACEALRRSGYVVEEADCYEGAMQMLAQASTSFDLVVSDIVLPDGSGISIAQQVRARYPRTSVVLTSGYVDEKLAPDTSTWGGFPFLPKPYSLDQLVAMVQRVLPVGR